METDFILKAESTLRQEETDFTIAVENTLPLGLSAQLVKDIHNQFPATHTKWLSPGAGNLVSVIEEGLANIGLGITHSLGPLTYFAHNVGKMNFVYEVSPEHPLAKTFPAPTQNDLNGFKAIINSGRKTITEEMLTLGAMSMIEVESYQGVKELVCRGLGWGALPRHMITDELRQGSLCEFLHPLGMKSMDVTIDIIWCKEHSDGPVTQWSIQYIKDYWQDI